MQIIVSSVKILFEDNRFPGLYVFAAIKYLTLAMILLERLGDSIQAMKQTGSIYK